MIAVIFEVIPFIGERHRYLDLAGELRDHLESMAASCPSSASKA
jgi:hypothetical protein